jgi:hypothetical protein
MNDDKENEETLKLLRAILNWLTLFGVITILGIVVSIFTGILLFV